MALKDTGSSPVVRPIFCLVLKSTSASDALNALVQQLKNSDLQSFCDCHVFSLSDIVAQSLEKSKVPLTIDS